jgi:hypothetical protein
MKNNFLNSAVLLGIVGLAVWASWLLLIGGPVTYDALIGDIKHQGIDDIQLRKIVALVQATVGYAILVYWLGGVFALWVWLWISNQAKLLRPDAVGRLRIVWLFILFAGGALVVGGGWYFLSDVFRYMPAEVIPLAPVVPLLLFILTYWVLGSWLFTRRAALPAVPLALLVR